MFRKCSEVEQILMYKTCTKNGQKMYKKVENVQKMFRSLTNLDVQNMSRKGPENVNKMYKKLQIVQK
jgi:hypothetical protein